MTRRNEEETHFGFRRVKADEKARLVRDVFDHVADRYDLMNDLMSAGVHRLWKGALLDRLDPQPGTKLLDVAGGTGDVAMGFLNRANARPNAGERPAARAIICDVNHQMLKAGVRRKEASAFEGQLMRVCGDAERLPIADRSADAYVIAFGLRNVTDMAAALKEAWRVLNYGGRFICLEFSHPITEGLQKLYDAYSFNVIPRLGRMVAGDAAPYQYLVESIRKFPAQEALAQRISAAGFSRVRYENLTGGVAALHMAWRI
jgi:demethylmenaquinone methyltransferase/2-methoxy-6-polyprenyl-1,4-benzoquinol methylase